MVKQVDDAAFGAVCVGLGCCGAEVLGPGDMVVKDNIVGGGLVALALAFEEAAECFAFEGAAMPGGVCSDGGVWVSFRGVCCKGRENGVRVAQSDIKRGFVAGMYLCNIF